VRIRRSLIVLLLPLSFLAACGDDDDDRADATSPTTEPSADLVFGDAPDHTLGIDDNGRELTVEVGAVIDVMLESCPTCGYSWAQMGDAGTGGLALVEETDVDSDPNADGETGGNVDHWVRFEATASGDSNITLGYFGPGESPPEEVFDVVVHIAS
jgi:predicted secreted protein